MPKQESYIVAISGPGFSHTAEFSPSEDGGTKFDCFTLALSSTIRPCCNNVCRMPCVIAHVVSAMDDEGLLDNGNYGHGICEANESLLDAARKIIKGWDAHDKKLARSIEKENTSEVAD